MQAIVPYAIWAAVILSVLGIVAMLGFGVVSLIRGKAQPSTIAMVAIPLVLVLILVFLVGFTWAEAAIWTAVIMFGLGLLGLLWSGTSGLIGT